jgi:hypothetical protein
LNAKSDPNRLQAEMMANLFGMGVVSLFASDYRPSKALP